jgi:hypothetical protein
MLDLMTALGLLAEALGEKRGINGEVRDPGWWLHAVRALDEAEGLLHHLRWHLEGVTT